MQSAAARLDSLIDAWDSIEPDDRRTELLRVRGLLGVGPVVSEQSVDDDLLMAAAQRCDAITEALQSAGGTSAEIVMFRGLASTLRLWLEGRWDPTPSNFALRDNAVSMASALVTGQVLRMNRPRRQV